MPKSSRPKKQKAPRDDAAGGHPHVLAHFILGCVGLLAIAYGAVLLLSRTEGMRFIVRDKIETQIGMPVSIGRMRVTPGLDVVLEDITAGETKLVQIARVNIRGSLREKLKGGPWMQSAEIVGGTLALTQSPGGHWTPSACAPMSDWLSRWGGITIPSAPPPEAAEESSGGKDRTEKTVDAGDFNFDEGRGFHHRIPLLLRNGKIVWRDAQGKELASAGDIEIHLTPLKTQAREMQHAVFSAGHIRSAAGDYITGLFVELLSTQGHHILLAQRANRTQTAPAPAGAYEQTYEYGVPDYPPEDLQEHVREELNRALEP